jgi:hypothetical protein
MAGIPWTDEEIAILRKMIKAGCTARQISTVLESRTIHAINKKAQELDLSLSGGNRKGKINYKRMEELLLLRDPV